MFCIHPTLSDQDHKENPLHPEHAAANLKHTMVAARKNSELLVVIHPDFRRERNSGRSVVANQSAESHIMPPLHF
jgi:hypothetical protein